MAATVALEGLIGAGKSTVARLCETLFCVHVVAEPVATNPWLAKYYGAPARYANVTQAWMLKHRVHSEIVARAGGAWLILFDRKWPADYAFVVANTECGYITADFHARYLATIEALRAGGLPLGDACVFFDVSPEECLRRMTARGRDIEKGVPVAYQQALLRGYGRVRALTDDAMPWIDVDWETPIDDDATRAAAVDALLRTRVLPVIAPGVDWAAAPDLAAALAAPPAGFVGQAMPADTTALLALVDALYMDEVTKMADDDLPLGVTH